MVHRKQTSLVTVTRKVPFQVEGRGSVVACELNEVTSRLEVGGADLGGGVWCRYYKKTWVPGR